MLSNMEIEAEWMEYDEMEDDDDIQEYIEEAIDDC
jgi:DNA-binding phage protein